VLGVDAELSGGLAVFRVYARNATPTPYIPLVVEAPAGGAQALKAVYSGGCWAAVLELRGEGAYRVSVLDPETGVAVLTRVLELRDRPVIHSVRVEERAELGLATVTVNASDASGIAAALIEFHANNHSMIKLPSGLFAYNLSFGDSPETLQARIHVVDPFGNTASASIAVNWSLQDAFLHYASSVDLTPGTARSFYAAYPSLVEALYLKRRDLLTSPLRLFEVNATLFGELYRVVWADSQVKVDPNVLVSRASELALSLGLERVGLSPGAVSALGNLTVAYYQLNLPVQEEWVVWLLLNATLRDPAIVDFEPVAVRDAAGQTIIIQSRSVARDYWMIAEFLRNRPGVVNETWKYEWVNRMIQQLAWDIFDSPYGPDSRWVEPETGRVHEPENLAPTSREVWQVILGFYDYMDSLPSRLERDGVGVVFPYSNSTALKGYIADKTNRTVALLYLASIPSVTLDKLNYKAKWDEAWRMYRQGLIDKDTLGKLLDKALKESIVIGINAMKKFIEQLPSEYEEIVKLYPSGKVGRWSEDPRGFYKGWLADRFCHGLSYTVGEYVGFDDSTVEYFAKKCSSTIVDHYVYPNWNEMEFRNKIDQSYGIDQFLTKNWKYWDLVKFIYGYERFKSGDWGGEWEMYRYGLPLAFKAFGIPHNQGIGASATSGNFGGYNSYGHVEFTIYGIPQDVIDKLLNQKDLGRIAIGYGNGISLMSCIDGVEKDTGYEIFQWSPRWTKIYLWRKRGG